MSRRVSAVVVALTAAAGTARAQPADDAGEAALPELTEQMLGADLGIATGGRVTPGGARLDGHYLYQLSDQDWFDGVASFTFGGGGAACFRDRSNMTVCEHGAVDGRGVEITASVRRWFAPRGKMRPFARLGVGVGIVRFSDDSLTGLSIPAHAGGGVRAAVSDDVAIVGQADLGAGIGLFGKGLGSQPQIGLAITAGVEFALR
jgi:hypothetical protein